MKRDRQDDPTDGIATADATGNELGPEKEPEPEPPDLDTGSTTDRRDRVANTGRNPPDDKWFSV